MNRREFIKKVSKGAAVGGGLLLLGGTGQASGSVGPRGLAAWPEPYRPASPKRLAEATHALARRAISGEHGRAMAKAGFALDSTEVAGLSADMRYARACMLVAEKAPLRVLTGELIVGSATLEEAAFHMTPVAGVSSTSHTTLGFDRVMKIGYKGLREQIAQRLARGGFEASEPPATFPGRIDGRALAGSGDGRRMAEAAPRVEYDQPPLTVECWARINSKGGFNVIVANRTKESGVHWEIYTYAGSGCFSAYLPGYAPAEIVSARDVTDGQWHFLAMAFEPGRVRLYVDGELVKDAAVTAGAAGPGPAAGALSFGGYAGVIGCDGAVDEVRISRGVFEPVVAPAASMRVDARTLGLWRVGEEGGAVVFRDSVAANHARLATPSRGEDLLRSMALCLDAAAVWHRRYLDELDARAAVASGPERDTWLRVIEALRNVPENPPQTFHEAVQSLWFMYAFQRLMGTWSGIGRIDALLGPYLERDLAEGRITLDEAREILAHMWIKGCEWIGALDARGSGDAQHYQNIVLSGIDASGCDITNDVTYLVLDIVEELHISDFPIAVRINRDTPERLLRRIAEVQRHGGGICAIYNEEVVIDGLVKFGYPVEEARTFANDGCWETIIPGRTTFSYVPFDALALLHQTLGLHEPGAPAPDFASFDDLYAAYIERLRAQIDNHNKTADGWAVGGHPTPLVSLFVEDCIERGRSYFDRGSRYTVLAPHAGGMANVANSLMVIDKLVYQDKQMTLPEFVAILRSDWKDSEPLRRSILHRFDFYGNDSDEADAAMRRVFDDYTAIVAEVRERNGVRRPCGISTFGREIEWSVPTSGRRASPDGHRRGEVLATNCSPSPGTDKAGPTAVIKSYCKLDFTRTPNGATMELKMHPETVKGERGIDAMVALMRGFVRLGGWFMHTDVVDTAMLRDAQEHPEKYPNLSVRVAGWSARFATLNQPWQDMVINRTQQYI